MTARCWKFGDNISTDAIIPARYLSIIDPRELAGYVMSGADPEFARKFKPGDIIMAGENFGYGSSREHAPMAIKAASAGAVIAVSFARIFYRNAINIGLPIITCPEAVAGSTEGDEIEVDLKQRTVINRTRNRSFVFPAYPDFILEIMEKGGLIEALNEKLALAKRKK